jgi:hypothetical protein
MPTEMLKVSSLADGAELELSGHEPSLSLPLAGRGNLTILSVLAGGGKGRRVTCLSGEDPVSYVADEAPLLARAAGEIVAVRSRCGRHWVAVKVEPVPEESTLMVPLVA